MSRQHRSHIKEKAKAGALDEDGAAAALMAEYEAHIAALERRAVLGALEIDFRKGLNAPDTRPETDLYLRAAAAWSLRPAKMRIDRRRALQFHRRSRLQPKDAALVAQIRAIADEFEAGGPRRRH